MIKSSIIIVIFASGCLCRVLPDEVPTQSQSEERRVDIPGGAENKSADSKTTTSLPEEVRVDEEEKTATAEETKDGKADLENPEDKSIKPKSAEEVKAASQVSEEAVAETKSDVTDTTTDSENPEASVRTDTVDGDSDKTLSSERSEENPSSKRPVRSNDQNNASQELRSTLETKTSEQDDPLHIQTKEQRENSGESRADGDQPSQRSESEYDSKTGSEQNESKMASDGELTSVEEELKAASPEDNTRSDEAGQENARSDSEADEGLIRSDTADEILPGLTRRMLGHNFSDDKLETSSSNDEAETRMAPKDEDRPSGPQVHSNYFGESRASQSQYPYTPVNNTDPPTESRSVSSESTSLLNKLASSEAATLFPLSKLAPTEAASLLPFPPSFSTEHTSIPFKFPSHPEITTFPSFPNEPSSIHNMLPSFPNLLPQLPKSAQPFIPTQHFENHNLKPLPLLPQNHQPESNEPKPMTFLPPLEPLQPLQPLQPLPPLEPLQPLPPLEHNGPFKPLQPAKPFQEPLWHIQNWQQQPFRRLPSLMPPLPPLLPLMQPFRPVQNMFSTLRQAQPETQQFTTFSKSWTSDFPVSPFAVSSVRQSSQSFSSS